MVLNLMGAYRKKPALWGTPSVMSSPGSYLTGCILEAVIFVIGSLIFAALDRISDSMGNKWRQVIYYGIGAIVVILVIRQIIIAYRKRQHKQTAKQHWKATSKTALVNIMARKGVSSWREKYANRYTYTANYLDLKMTSDQQAASPSQETIRVEVKPAILKRLKERNTVRIYYQPDSPLTFLLEEEL
jgi:divalent metal cation (Fe/Co/Zn/Cd) transporter